MPQVVIENPILNSPYVEPARHFKFGDDGITDEIVESRRVSSYFVPIPAAKKKGKQLVLDNEWTIDRIKENEFINQVRGRVGQWRRAGHLGVTRTTKLLLDYWADPGRERRLFFCQIEALETAIYLGEVAGRLGDSWIENQLREFNQAANPWLFPQVLAIAHRWLDECLMLKDGTFPQLLLLAEPAHDAADRIYQAIVAGDSGENRLKPILQPYDTVGSTRWVDFDTSRPVYTTDSAKCHLSHVVADTESWEQKMAQALEGMPEVEAYAKNHNLGFFIPYTLNGEEHRYIPDFLVRLRTAEGSGATGGDATDGDMTDGDATERREGGCGEMDGGAILNLILEVSGEARKDKAAKVAAARSLWVPAVNNHGGFGRWAFVEISDPWDAQGAIRAAGGGV